MKFFTTILALTIAALASASAILNSHPAVLDVQSGCKEGQLKCLAAQDNGTDGGVFQCTKSGWKLIQDCRSYEKCVSKPTPHCTWAASAEVEVETEE